MGSRPHTALFGRAIGVVLLAVVGLVIAVAVAPHDARGADGATATFVDATGDSGSAPDISTCTVSEDANGTLSFTITTAGFSAAPPTGGWNGVDFFVDADANLATGDDFGNEYMLRIAHEADKPVEAYLFQSVDGSWKRVDNTSLAAAGDGDTVTLTVAASDIGVTGGFRFYAAAGARDSAGNATHYDYSPDHGAWVFPATAGETLTSAETALPVTATPRSTVLVIGPPATQPAKPVAGSTFTAAFSLSVAGADAARVTAVAHARVGGHAVQASTRVHAGSALVSIRIPATAGGRQLTLSLHASTPSGHATRSAAFGIVRK